VGIDPSPSGPRGVASALVSAQGAVPAVQVLTGPDRPSCGILGLAGTLLCVETPSAVYRRAAGKPLLGTAFHAGLCFAQAEYGIAIHAEDWRQWLTGKRTASNREIHDALLRHVALPKRTNNHQRDAVGIALYGLHLMGATWAMPPALTGNGRS
jgi:hypothetical protein